MKISITVFLILITLSACKSNESIFELDQQSMLMTGKGPGQDGAINPFYGQKSIAVVKNMSENTFHVRVQQDGNIINELPIAPGVTKEIILEPDQQLYLDSPQKSKLKLDFKKFKG